MYVRINICMYGYMNIPTYHIIKTRYVCMYGYMNIPTYHIIKTR
jgi:hypothetical protein